MSKEKFPQDSSHYLFFRNTDFSNLVRPGVFYLKNSKKKNFSQLDNLMIKSKNLPYTLAIWSQFIIVAVVNLMHYVIEKYESVLNLDVLNDMSLKPL